MKKGIRIVGIAIICIGIIVGYYYYLSNHGKKDVENSTEISKVDEALSRDLAKDYPPTPREVVKFYNKLLQCFYNEDCSKSEIEELGGQARLHYWMMLYWPIIPEGTVPDAVRERYSGF